MQYKIVGVGPSNPHNSIELCVPFMFTTTTTELLDDLYYYNHRTTITTELLQNKCTNITTVRLNQLHHYNCTAATKTVLLQQLYCCDNNINKTIGLMPCVYYYNDDTITIALLQQNLHYYNNCTPLITALPLFCYNCNYNYCIKTITALITRLYS